MYIVINTHISNVSQLCQTIKYYFVADIVAVFLICNPNKIRHEWSKSEIDIFSVRISNLDTANAWKIISIFIRNDYKAMNDLKYTVVYL